MVILKQAGETPVRGGGTGRHGRRRGPPFQGQHRSHRCSVVGHYLSAATTAARLECATGGEVLLFQFTSDIVGGEQCRRTDEDG